MLTQENIITPSGNTASIFGGVGAKYITNSNDMKKQKRFTSDSVFNMKGTLQNLEGISSKVCQVKLASTF